MAITSDRLKQAFSEGGAKEIYHEIKAGDEFLGVQTLCVKLAYRMCGFFPELMEEFRRSLGLRIIFCSFANGKTNKPETDYGTRNEILSELRHAAQ